jgi:LacI family transcriptional regulator
MAFLIADPIGSVPEDLFFNEVLRGVTEHLEPRGYHALMSPSSGKLGAGARPPAVLQRVDGVIAGGVSLQGPLVKALMEGPVPIVFIGRFLRGKGMNAVLSDNQEGGRLATEHLLGLGRGSVAFVGGPPNTNVYRDRLAGYRCAFEEAGRGVEERLVRPAPRTAQGGFEATLGLLDDCASSGVFPDAIFAADDWLATGVLRALRERGRRVPEDVAVVGYSDLALAAHADPPLTTVHVPKRRLGRAAAKLLLDLIAGDIEGPVQMVVSPHLVVRESTGGQDAVTAAGDGAP